MCWIFYLKNPSFAIVIEASRYSRCFNHRFCYLCIYFSWYIQNHQNPLSILAFFTPFVILCLSKICRFTAYILTIVKKIVAHNTSHYLFVGIIHHNTYGNKKDPDLRLYADRGAFINY